MALRCIIGLVSFNRERERERARERERERRDERREKREERRERERERESQRAARAGEHYGRLRASPVESQTLFARKTVRPCNRRAAPAGACPQAWGNKEREREREN